MVPNSQQRKGGSRLALRTRSAGLGGLDGGWWPATAELRDELPDLLCVVGSMIGEIRRVVYDPRSWQPAPRRVIRHGRSIAVDPYAMLTSEMIYLVGTHTRDAVFFAIPPACDADVGERLLATVSDESEDVTAFVLRRLLTTSTRSVGKSTP